MNGSPSESQNMVFQLIRDDLRDIKTFMKDTGSALGSVETKVDSVHSWVKDVDAEVKEVSNKVIVLENNAPKGTLKVKMDDESKDVWSTKKTIALIVGATAVLTGLIQLAIKLIPNAG